MRALAALLAAAILGVSGAGLAAESAAPWPGPAGIFDYAIERDGDLIGTQRIRIAAKGDLITAVTETELAVRLLGIVVYRKHQKATETYRAGEAVAVDSVSDGSDGDSHLALKRRQGEWTGTFDGKAARFACDCALSPLWNVASLQKPSLLRLATAEAGPLRVSGPERVSLDLPRGPVAADRYRLTGVLERTVWYGEDGRLLASEEKGSDGSLIRQVLTARSAQ